MFKYQPNHIDFLRANYPLMNRNELVTAFNRHFGIDRSITSVVCYLKNHGIISGRDGRFLRGGKAWNKGIKGYMGANATSFKKGHLPHNHRPLWSERIGKGGYIEISVPERNPYTGSKTRFKHKHVWIWEQANGPKPKGMVIIFKDGNNRNFNLSNLVLLTKTELLVANSHGYKVQPEELKPSILALARVEARAGFRTHPARSF